jgi:hypothetical protein
MPFKKKFSAAADKVRKKGRSAKKEFTSVAAVGVTMAVISGVSLVSFPVLVAGEFAAKKIATGKRGPKNG